MQPVDCQTCKIKHRWRSIGSHLKDLLTVLECSTIVRRMHIAIIDSQYIDSVYNHLHPKASGCLCFWATSIHIVWAMNEVGPSRVSPFGQWFTAYCSKNQILIYIAWLLRRSLFSSFSSISMTYQKEFRNLDDVQQVWAERYRVGCIDWCSITIVIHPGSGCALTAISMTHTTSLP